MELVKLIVNVATGQCEEATRHLLIPLYSCTFHVWAVKNILKNMLDCNDFCGKADEHEIVKDGLKETALTFLRERDSRR